MKLEPITPHTNINKLFSVSVFSSWGYIVVLWLCLVLKFVFRDQWWWLGFLNSFTLYWFVPLFIIVPLALIMKRRWLQMSSLISVCIFLCLFGQLLIPKGGHSNSTGRSITVMTYNLFGGNQDWDAIYQTISDSNADVIALQELNREVAATIQSELTKSYPYQIVDSQDSLISRYPITLTNATLPDSWGSPPKIYTIDFDGEIVTLLNAHFYASLPNFNDYYFMQWVFREREHQAQLVTEFAEQIKMPLIVTSDFNATDQSQAYRLITSHLNDSWREAGWGLGHTFPGGSIPNLPRPVISGTSIPMWVARIDYIFYSDHWKAIEARLGIWDGISDHRPVITILELREE